MRPQSRSCTSSRSARLVASVLTLGRRAARSACHCAVMSRSSKSPPGVAELRLISREIVLGDLRSLRAIARNPVPRAHSRAISARSETVRLRLVSAAAVGERWAGGIAPELRNHRIPTGPETSASTAASAPDRPAATPRQNRHGFSRCQTGGRPGAHNLRRAEHSDFRLPVVIDTSWSGVLRRPVESAQYLSIKYTERLAEAEIDLSVGTVGDACDNALAECVIGLFKTEVINQVGPWKSMREVEWETLKRVDWYNNRRRLAPIGYVPPAEAEEAFYANLHARYGRPVVEQTTLRQTRGGACPAVRVLRCLWPTSARVSHRACAISYLGQWRPQWRGRGTLVTSVNDNFRQVSEDLRRVSSSSGSKRPARGRSGRDP